MSRRQLFLLYYYSQLPIVITAMVLTGTINAVLFQELNFFVIILVGLATFLTYSIDNLVDWHKDAAHYVHINRYIAIYHKVTFILIPISALGVIVLTCKSSNELQIGMLLLGATAVIGTTRLPGKKEEGFSTQDAVRRFLINRMFISTVWTIVSVFLPIWYSGGRMTPRILTIFLYIFCLVFIYSVLWKFEKSAYGLKRKLLDSKIFKVLVGFGSAAILLVFFDILSGFAPIYNLVNILPPIISMIYIKRILQKPVYIRRKISQFTAGLIMLCSLSSLVFLMGA